MSDITSLLRVLEPYPGLRAIAGKNPTEFASLDPGETQRVLFDRPMLIDAEHGFFADADRARKTSAMIRYAAWRTARRTDCPVDAAVVALTDALDAALSDDGFEVASLVPRPLLLPSGNRRLDGLASAILRLEGCLMFDKVAQEAAPEGGEEAFFTVLSVMGPVAERLAAGVRASDAERFFRTVDPREADWIRLMARHYNCLGDRSGPQGEEVEREFRRLKLVGLLDMPGEPDLHPIRLELRTPEEVAVQVPPEDIHLVARLGADVCAWKRENPGASITAFVLPELWRHAEILKLAELGFVTRWDIVLIGGTDAEIGHEISWGLSETDEANLAASEPLWRGSDRGTQPTDGTSDEPEFRLALLARLESESNLPRGKALPYAVREAGGRKVSLVRSRSWGNVRAAVEGTDVERHYAFDFGSGRFETIDDPIPRFRVESNGVPRPWKSAEEIDTILAGLPIREMLDEARLGALADMVKQATLHALELERDWGHRARAFDESSARCEEAERDIAEARSLVGGAASRRNSAALPERRVDSPLGVLRVRAIGWAPRRVEVLPSAAASRRRVIGALEVDEGSRAIFDEHGTLVEGAARVRGCGGEDGAAAVARAVRDYIERCPTAFDEARLSLRSIELLDLEFELEKADDAEESAWSGMLDAFERLDDLRTKVAAWEPGALDGLPDLRPPEDPYTRDRDDEPDFDEDLSDFDED